jgi:hypothetical protein
MNLADFLNNSRYQHVTPDHANPGDVLPDHLVAGTLPPLMPAQTLAVAHPQTPPNLPPIMSLYRSGYNTIR